MRYLWSRRAEAFITIITVISILGVAIGVMVLNIVMAVMTGFEHELQQKIIGTSSHIVVRKLAGDINDWRGIVEGIRTVPGVESVSPFTYHQALLHAGERSTGLLIRGIEKGTSSAEQLASYMKSKADIQDLFDPPAVSMLQESGSTELVQLPGLIVGRELARMLNLYKGSTISLLSPGVSSTPFGLMPRYRRFMVAGIYNSGLVEYESGVAYASLEMTQQFFRLGDAVSGMEVRVRALDDAPRLAREIVQALGGIGSGFYAQDWTETNRPLWEALRLEKHAYFIVLLLIVVMASFSIITTLVMVVLEKRKDIAILRTLGATTRSVQFIFLLMGAVIGGLGTVLGLIGGVLGCLGLEQYGFPLDQRIFPVSTLPIRMIPTNFLLVGVCSFAICLLATIYPALRASRLEPSEVLRYE